MLTANDVFAHKFGTAPTLCLEFGGNFCTHLDDIKDRLPYRIVDVGSSAQWLCFGIHWGIVDKKLIKNLLEICVINETMEKEICFSNLTDFKDKI